MPPWPEHTESALVSLVEKRKDTSDDASYQPRRAAGKRRGGAAAGPLSAASPTSPTGPSPSAPAAAPPKPQSATADLLSLMDDSAPAAAAPSMSVSDFAASPAASSEGPFVTVLQRLSGVLYEDDAIQIGAKVEVQGNKARVSLFYGNRTGGALSLFVLVDGDASVGAPDVPGLSLKVAPAPTSIAAQAQVQQIILAAAVGEVEGEPLMRVAFGGSGSALRKITLRVPVAASLFMQSMSLGVDDFFARWKQLGGPPKEAANMFRLAAGKGPAAIKTLLAGFGLTVLEGIDPNADNAVAAAVYAHAAGKVGALVRVQINPADQMCKVTARTTSAAVSSAVVKLITMALTN